MKQFVPDTFSALPDHPLLPVRKSGSDGAAYHALPALLPQWPFSDSHTVAAAYPAADFPAAVWHFYSDWLPSSEKPYKNRLKG